MFSQNASRGQALSANASNRDYNADPVPAANEEMPQEYYDMQQQQLPTRGSFPLLGQLFCPRFEWMTFTTIISLIQITVFIATLIGTAEDCSVDFLLQDKFILNKISTFFRCRLIFRMGFRMFVCYLMFILFSTFVFVALLVFLVNSVGGLLYSGAFVKSNTMGGPGSDTLLAMGAKYAPSIKVYNFNISTKDVFHHTYYPNL